MTRADGLDSDDDMFGDDDDMLSFCTDISDGEVEELNNDDDNTDTNTTTTTQQLPKKRGRPKGSTNKKNKSNIGRKFKKKMQGTSSYIPNKRARRSSTTSNQHTNASNNTNSTDTLKSTDALDLIEVRLLISYYKHNIVTHVVLESKKLYEGTQYEDSWMFYHDALSLMTDKSCVEWMKKQHIDESNTISYYDKWILPVLGLNDEYTRYKGRPIGNSPEMMPLDNCLNKDLHELVARHVLMSRASAMNKDDPRIFSLSTYKKVASAYKRIWSPTSGVGPPSKRIVQDITKVVDAMKQIYKQEGAFVPDIAQRPGDRHIINQLKSKIWGGKRTKKEAYHILFADRDDLHDDLKAILAEEKSGM